DRIDGTAIREGDIVLGLASSGPHSNGYSLVRRILDVAGADVNAPFENSKTLLDILLTPTRIYVSAIASLLLQVDVHGMAHITGGGLAENLARVMPDGLAATIDGAAWPRPAIFN